MLLPLVASVVVLLVAYWIRWRQKIFRTFEDLGVPGPKPNIFFGNMLEMYRKGPIECQEKWISKYGNILGYYFGMRPILLITDPEAIKQVQIKEFQKFIDRPISLFRLLATKNVRGSQHMINQRGKEWKETRTLLTPAFTTGKLKQMSVFMSDAIDVTMGLVKEQSKNGQEFNIYPLWQGLTADVIARTAFGVEAGVQGNSDHPMIRSARVFFSDVNFQTPLLLFGFSFKEFGRFFFAIQKLAQRYYNKMQDPVDIMLSRLEKVITFRRTQNVKRPDLLQSLIDAGQSSPDEKIDVQKLASVKDSSDDSESHQEQIGTSSPRKGIQLSDKKVQANAMMMFLAGYETTSTALAFTTYALVKHQDVQDRLREEVKELIEKEGELSPTSVLSLPYMDQVFSESLRLYSPIFLFVNRETVQEVQIGDYSIPKGMAIQIPVYWLHNSSEFWDNPKVFDPSRFEGENSAKSRLVWQPFGAGPRNCIGMRFALLEAKLAISKLLLQYRLQPSQKTDTDDIRSKQGLFIRAPSHGVYLKAVPLST